MLVCICLLVISQALLQAINNAGGREDIIEPAVCALRHITGRHPSAELAQNAVRMVGGIPVVATFLHQQCRWPLLKVHVRYIHVLYRLYLYIYMYMYMYIYILCECTCTCTCTQCIYVW